MTNTNEIRKNLDLVTEMGKSVSAQNGADKNKDVKVNLETLARQVPQGCKAMYPFNKGFLTFQDIMDDPRPFIEKYRKESGVTDTTNLLELMKGFKPENKFTQKEKYLRAGYESRGFANAHMVLVWWKEKAEQLIMFAKSKENLVEVREFLKFYRVIR